MSVEHDLLGIIHMRLGNLDKALVHFRTSVGLFPSGIWVHVNLGLAYVKDGQLGRAIEEWEMALALGFEDCTLRLHTALLLSELRLVPQTIAAYRRFLDHCPDHTAAPEIRSLLERLAQVDGSDETADEQLPPEPERRGPNDEW